MSLMDDKTREDVRQMLAEMTGPVKVVLFTQKFECQMCAENRCRKCREGGHSNQTIELGPAFTHGEYLAWKKRKREARDAVTDCPGR